jgi:hypothetical protein
MSCTPKLPHENSDVLLLHLPHENLDALLAPTSSPTTWKLRWAASPNFLMKTQMCFLPQLPHRRHENLDALLAPTSSWKLRCTSCSNFLRINIKHFHRVSSPRSWVFNMKHSTELRAKVFRINMKHFMQLQRQDAQTSSRVMKVRCVSRFTHKLPQCRHEKNLDASPIIEFSCSWEEKQFLSCGDSTS